VQILILSLSHASRFGLRGHWNSRLADLRTTSSEQCGQRLYQILEEMPAISDLNSLWGAFLCCCGVLAPTVTTDHFHFGMLL
jgi:hypothetical protein